MSRISLRDGRALAIISLLTGIIFTYPAFDGERGLSIDILTALRWQVFGARHQPASQPAVVVAIDEESYRTSPFRDSPTLTWTGEIGRVLTAIIDGGAKVVGFDVIFPTSIEQSEIPFGKEVLGARVRGFDRDFLRALRNGATAGKVVLGEVRNNDQSIRPASGQRIAVGQQSNIRALNVYVDTDQVVRRLPLTFSIDGQAVPSMAVELASRAIGSTLQIAPDGKASLADYRIRSSLPNTMVLNFEGGADDIPTFSFADLRACADSGNKAFFHDQFDGKVVIIGTVLDSEDRKLTSKRFVTGLEGARAPRCGSAPPHASTPFLRSTIAGVYIHATAVNNLIGRHAVREFGTLSSVPIAIAFSAVASAAALILAPAFATLLFLAAAAAYIGTATVAFQYSVLALPITEPILSGLAAVGLTVGYRFAVSDRSRRFLRKSFELYLSPRVIETMMTSNKPPELGGEMREVTVLFTDVVGFSSIAETMSPDALVQIMNEYLSAMTDIVEDNRGYVEKYIGDSIVAVFGAPVDDPDHAFHAVGAALRCRTRLEELNQSVTAFQGHHLRHRIGINTGDALVGNIGSRRRFNYTVMSDAVNVASRLEGANKSLGTSIMVSETTVKLTGTAFEWRELDTLRVKGRARPINVYEPLAKAGELTPEQLRLNAVYANGLASWRDKDYEGAAEKFATLADQDATAAFFLKRARGFIANPPPPDWKPVSEFKEE